MFCHTITGEFTNMNTSLTSSNTFQALSVYIFEQMLTLNHNMWMQERTTALLVLNPMILLNLKKTHLTYVSDITKVIDLIPPKVACFAGMNMCVSASSWLQGDTKSVFIALLLTTFVISVIFRITEICKISCSGNSKLFKSELLCTVLWSCNCLDD